VLGAKSSGAISMAAIAPVLDTSLLRREAGSHGQPKGNGSLLTVVLGMNLVPFTKGGERAKQFIGGRTASD